MGCSKQHHLASYTPNCGYQTFSFRFLGAWVVRQTSLLPSSVSLVCVDSRIVYGFLRMNLVCTEQGTEARYLLALSWEYY